MARSIPKVRDASLHLPTIEGSSTSVITLGSAEWYTWLEHSRSFRFETPHSTFTARQEQRPGGWYWYAYRRHHGKLHIAYLGKSEELTIERLNAVASVLESAKDGSEGTRQRFQQASVNVSLQANQTPIILFPTALSVADALTQPELALRHNLPIQRTSLVGREPATATATALLRRPEVRLLSMIGTGGIGKTRLAIEVATELLEDFTDGIYFVALAPLRDPNLVLPTIARTLGVKESGSETVTDRIHEYLRHKHLLLVLDNFEHLMTAAPLVGELLTACPKLKLLVTSREVLHLRAEQQFSVPPLGLPDRKHFAHVESLTRYPALDLFIQRARTFKHDFQLNDSNAQSLAEICARLDGLPLAIELAAARIKFLSPQALLARLDHRLQVLTSGARDLPERQQTLRNTIQWSYELLNTQEQRLFWRLSVFVGGCTLEAIEAVCAALGDATEQVLDGVASLIDKSLLHHTEIGSEEPRLHMLETIHEYGLELLTASGEMEVTQQSHAEYYLKLAEEAGPHFGGAEEARWLDRLEREHGNLRVAIQWALEGEAASDSRHSIEIALRLGIALLRFWIVRGPLSEGWNVMKRGLARSEGVAPLLRAKAFDVTGMLAYHQDDLDQTEVLCKESLALFRELGNKAGMASSLFSLQGAAQGKGDLGLARVLLEEALSLSKELGDKERVSWLYSRLAGILQSQGEYTKAAALREESLRLFREQGNVFGVAATLNQLSLLLLFTGGDSARVRSLAEEGLALAKELGHTSLISQSFLYLAQAALAEGDTARACRLLEEAPLAGRKIDDREGQTLLLALEGKAAMMQGNYTIAYALYKEALALNYKPYMPFCLEGLADAAIRQGEPEWAARLWGAVEALRDAMATPIPPVERASYERSVAAARAQIGVKAFALLWNEGRTMSPEQALAAQRSAALSKQAPRALQSANTEPRPSSQPIRLTTRERDVLHLLTTGLTSAQIAEQLVLSLPTVNTHVRSIYNKLGVNSRSAATRYAVEHHLV